MGTILYRADSVSIHARVERATIFAVSSSFQISSFNPRTRRACDCSRFADDLVDFDVSIHARVERATTLPLQIIQLSLVSIHARVERATA